MGSAVPRATIAAAALQEQLDPWLVEAQVVTESAYDPYAWKPEPRYHYLWDVRLGQPFRALTDLESASEFPPADFHSLGGSATQEWWGQQASWGLLQVMGAVARERGFKGLYLPQIVEPGLNLALGCAFLASLKTWAGGDMAKALGAYNAGRGGWSSPAGVSYAAKILALRETLKGSSE